MGTPSENVFAPPKSNVVDVQSGDEAEKASRGIRLLAKILDGLAFFVGMLPAYITVFPQAMHAGARSGNPFQFWSLMAQTGGRFYLGVLLSVVVIVLNALWVAQNGQTVGKKICGIKIVRSDGSKATFWRIFLMRYLISTIIAIVPLIGFVYTLTDVLFIFGGARRCVHDYIADTIVVRA